MSVLFEGDYMVEAGGITHQPFTGLKGMMLLGFMFGPIGGYDEAGHISRLSKTATKAH